MLGRMNRPAEKLDAECVVVLKEVWEAQKTSNPINALTGNPTQHPLSLGHLLFEGYVQNDARGNLSLTRLGLTALLKEEPGEA